MFCVFTDFPVQQVQLEREGSSVADHNFLLRCIGTRDPLLVATLELEWLSSGGTPILEGSGISISGPSSTNDASITSTLEFDNLRTSQGGPYTCRVNITISEQNVTDYPVTKTAEVVVQRK